MNLFIMEKKSQYDQVRKLEVIKPQDGVLFTQSLGLYYSKTPKISFPDLPFTGEMVEGDYHKHLHKHPAPYRHSGGEFTRGECGDEMQFTGKDYVEIILMVDFDRVGFYAGYQIIDKLGYAEHPNITYCKMVAYDATSLNRAFNGRSLVDAGFYRWLGEQRLKRTFDYWWRANSHLVFGEVFKWGEVTPDGAISKYQIYALCILRDAQHLKPYELIDILQKPKPGERYANKTASAGSPVSYDEIISGLVAADFVCSEGDIYRLSPKGTYFVDMLHPKTYDADLPFRIKEWLSAKDLMASKFKMKRYINQLFGRQLRYQRKRKKEA